MEFSEAIKAFWVNAFKFDGRASRSEFWSGYLPILAVGLIFGILQNQAKLDVVAAIKAGSPTGISASLTYLQNLSYFGLGVWLITIVPMVSGMVRRLHDRGFWWVWSAVGVIPIIGTIWALAVLTQRGTKGPNRFGEDPSGGRQPTPHDNQARHQSNPVNSVTASSRPKATNSPAPSAPEMDGDALYEQAFNEMQADKTVVATWSRAFSEAEGDEQKAKALYISARVASLKQEILSRHYLETEQLEAEHLAKTRAEQQGTERLVKEKAEQMAVEISSQGKSSKTSIKGVWRDSKPAVGLVILLSVVGLIFFRRFF
jgi:uncharacterized membrane protein YhaH (DUF805 family)